MPYRKRLTYDDYKDRYENLLRNYRQEIIEAHELQKRYDNLMLDFWHIAGAYNRLRSKSADSATLSPFGDLLGE